MLEVGILADDGGRLSSELENDGLEVLSAERSVDRSDASRAGEAVPERASQLYTPTEPLAALVSSRAEH